MAQKITMYLGSMDHSPSEQLVDLAHWHTTVLIVSETGNHFRLATKLLESANNTPRKWSKSSQRHKRKLENSLETGLDGVHIRAISAQGATLENVFDHMISEMGLIRLTHSTVKNQKRYIQFGPFTRVKPAQIPNGAANADTEPTIFLLPRNQAIPLIFICHFLLRTHGLLLKLIRTKQPDLEWIDWQLMPNRFPGDVNGPMGSLFHAIMSGAPLHGLVAGTIRVHTFNETAADAGSTLADNIAGLLANKLKAMDFERRWQPPSAHGGMDWEIWS